jgi:hypothetical protein
MLLELLYRPQHLCVRIVSNSILTKLVFLLLRYKCVLNMAEAL